MAEVRQLVLPLQPGNAMTRADFIVAPGNARALAFLDSFPDWPAPAVALHGPSAAGKTHLARIWAAASGAALVDARHLRAPVQGPAVVENIDFACEGDEAFGHEPALFAMLEQGLPLLAFELGASDEALLMALAVKLFADRQLTVPESVVTHLVRTLERSPAALRDFIQRADARALAEKKPINLQLIRALIAD